MENEFLPYEQALALKELGFDEPCFATIDQIEYLYIKGTKKSPRGSMMYDTIDCSTYSQAFRWFREKYGLYPCVASYFGGAVFGIEDKNRNYHNKLKFKTHEEAELECLKKLIETVKKTK